MSYTNKLNEATIYVEQVWHESGKFLGKRNVRVNRERFAPAGHDPQTLFTSDRPEIPRSTASPCVSPVRSRSDLAGPPCRALGTRIAKGPPRYSIGGPFSCTRSPSGARASQTALARLCSRRDSPAVEAISLPRRFAPMAWCRIDSGPPRIAKHRRNASERPEAGPISRYVPPGFGPAEPAPAGGDGARVPV